MKCPFCLEEIIDGAKVCRFCGKEQPAAKAEKRFNAWRFVLSIVAIFIVLFVIAAALGRGDANKSVTERAHDACEKQYPGDTTDMQQCVAALELQWLEDQQAQKMRDAKNQSGL
jgi:hypothetical protein